MTKGIDLDLGMRIIKMVAVLLEQSINHHPHMLSEDLRKGGAGLVTLAATLDSTLPLALPLTTTEDVVARVHAIGGTSLIALGMLCDLEDRLWHCRASCDCNM